MSVMRIFPLLCLSLAWQAAALTGIGVSDKGASAYGWLSEVRAYCIKDNNLSASIPIYKGAITGAAINTYGTHVAFYRNDGAKTYISVVRTDGASAKAKDVTESSNAGSCSRRLLDWPRGDWIYYVDANRPDCCFKELWRVNVQTGVKELAYQWPLSGMCEFRISTLNNWAHINPDGADKPGRVVVKLDNNVSLVKTSWSSGGNVVGGGCTPTISPSGRFITGTTDAGHWGHTVSELTFSPRAQKNVCMTTSDLWNKWAQGDWPTKQAGVLGGMCGLTGNSFSVNSDKWVCYSSGIYPGGRFGDNGVNFVAVNWQDSLSVNVSRNPFTEENGTGRIQLFSVDFWVQEPLADVLPELQDDVRNRDSYKISGLDSGVGVGSNVRVQKGTGLEMRSASDFRMAFDAGNPGRGTVECFDGKGRLVAQRVTGNPGAELLLPGPGVYIVRPRSEATACGGKLIVQ